MFENFAFILFNRNDSENYERARETFYKHLINSAQSGFSELFYNYITLIKKTSLVLVDISRLF